MLVTAVQPSLPMMNATMDYLDRTTLIDSAPRPDWSGHVTSGADARLFLCPLEVTCEERESPYQLNIQLVFFHHVVYG